MCAGCTADRPSGSDFDLKVDYHAHTAFSGGRDSVGVVVNAAERAGLRGLVLADHAGAGTSWLPAYQSAIRRAQSRTDLQLCMAVEVEVLRADGWLDLPRDLSGLEAVSVSVSRLPGPGGPIPLEEARDLLRSGRMVPAEVAELVVSATVAGVERASRYAPTRLARPLSVLTQLGLDPDRLDERMLDRLAGVCRSTGAAVEVSEAWRAPSPRLAKRLAAAGVHLVPASDASEATRVGRWEYLLRLNATIEAAAIEVAAT